MLRSIGKQSGESGNQFWTACFQNLHSSSCDVNEALGYSEVSRPRRWPAKLDSRVHAAADVYTTRSTTLGLIVH